MINLGNHKPLGGLEWAYRGQGLAPEWNKQRALILGFHSSIRSSLVAISFTAIALILWLSGSFWYNAYLQRLDAAQLLESIETEDLLFESSRDLSKERSMVHLMLSAANPVENSYLAEIGALRTKTDAQYVLILKKIHSALIENSLSDRFTFVNSEIRKHANYVDESLHQLWLQRLIASEQGSVPLSSREASVKNDVFNQYTRLIDATQLLRQGVHFVPRHNELNIAHLQALRVATWQFSESIAKEASLVRGIIASSTKVKSGELQEIDYLHSETLRTWRTLQQYLKKRGTEANLVAVITQIEQRYITEFVKLRNIIASDYPQLNSASMSLEQWRIVEDRTTKLLDQLDRLSSDQIRKVATDVEAVGQRNLIIDSAIVLICLFIGVAVLGLLRKIQHLATHDALTGLSNRMRYEGLLLQDINHREDDRIAVMFVDLDGFKNINDTLGHDIGDQLLQQVANRITVCIANRGIAARYGGDEFSILCRNYANIGIIQSIADQLIETINQPFQIDGCNIRIGAGIGISVFPEDASTAEELNRNANFAMYYAKSQGRNCVCCFDHKIAAIYQQRVQLKTDLKHAIDAHQFELVYQPQVGAKSNVVSGVEALIRWRHPERGLISPNEFIPIAEESGQILEIGDWVLDEACRQMSLWHKSGLDNMQIAVNVCATQFMRPGFIEYVEHSCHVHGLKPSCLELEITESVLVTDVDQVINTCQRLRELSIRVAIDDFGTGYSSLSYLQDLPVDTLKIDRAFVIGLDNTTSKSVAKTIVSLAQSCGLETVAEGVETVDQLEMIHELGCDYIQGYFYSKPVSPEELPRSVDVINKRCSNNRHAA